MLATALLDALIIGSGPAGLATANALGRQMFKAVVFDSGEYRNARATHMHNVLGWDHQSPSVFRAKAKADIVERYKTIQFENANIATVRKTDNGQFEATDADGRSWTGRKLVLAVGAQDVFPDIEGYADCWGYGIFACLFCEGFEQAGAASVGVLVTPGPFAAHMVQISYQARRFADSVTLYTNGDAELTALVRTGLEGDKDAIAGRVLVDDRKISHVARGTGTESEIAFTFADGSSKTEGFVSHVPATKPNGPFIEQLGLDQGQFGEISVQPPFNAASVPGVFAVGDGATPMKAVATAQFMGAAAAAGVSMQIGQELAKEK